jgi:hypothetical protein
MRSLSVIVCVCSLVLLVGCGDDGTASGSKGQGYCEITCSCSGTLGAPASAVAQCISSCSGSILSQYDECPSELATWGDCLYGTGNCDVNQCLDEIGALDDCAFP